MQPAEDYDEIRSGVRALCAVSGRVFSLIFSYVAEHVLGLPRSY
jgi:hypothetical protein